MTRRFYAALEKRGPVGLVAMNLFRAQKCSKRAKKYGPYAGVGGSSFRDLAYERKAYSLKELVSVLKEHGAALGIMFGWGRDEAQGVNKWVLYVELPGDGGPQIQQVSFHSPDRYDGPDYPGKWDGRHASEERIISFCQKVFDGQTRDQASRAESVIAAH
jgi:hypothetical protein